MALNSLFCADVPLSNYSLTHAVDGIRVSLQLSDTFCDLDKDRRSAYVWLLVYSFTKGVWL